MAAGHRRPVFTQSALAFVARHSIVCSNDHRAGVPTCEDVARLCSIYNNLDDPLLKALPGDRDVLTQLLVRTAYEQFPLQGNIRYHSPRALRLFEIVPEDLRESRHAVDLESIFRQHVTWGLRTSLRGYETGSH